MNAQEYFNRGIEFFNQENYDGAISEFTEALGLDPNLVDAKNNLSDSYFNRGLANFRKGDSNKAITDISEAITLNPIDAHIYGARGYINSQIGNFDRAINDFTEAIRLAPTANDYLSRASAYSEKCKEARASGDKSGFFKYRELEINDYKAALKIDPTDKDVQKMLELAISEREHRKQVYEGISIVGGTNQELPISEDSKQKQQEKERQAWLNSEEGQRWYAESVSKLQERRKELEKYSVCISAGSSHTVGLKNDGTVVAVGSNYDNQCDVSKWRDIVAVAAGKNHTIGLKADGTAVAVGQKKDGYSYNVGNWRDIIAVFSGVSSTTAFGLKAGGKVVGVGHKDRREIFWSGIISVSASDRKIAAIRDIGTNIGICGYNIEGEDEVNHWRDIVSISAGSQHTVGLKTDGTVVAVGYNKYGQCNVNEWRDIVAVSAGGYHTVGLKTDGTVIAVGENDVNQCDISGWHNIVAISAGYNHTVGLKADNTVVAIGSDYGQCNTGDWQDIGPVTEERRNRMKQGLCIYCGGELSGLFTKKCKSCGKPK
jgi:alpha-tubulin suppressor-like RCC1 family protein